jgi:hypothetical protein
VEKSDFIRLEAKVDKISDQIGTINVTLAEQHVTLKEHIHRTELLEEAIRPVTPIVTIIKFLGVTLGVVIGSGFLYEVLKRLYL